MDKKQDVIKVVIADGEYMEAYAPLPENKKEADEKVKRGILKRLGMNPAEIDRVVNDLEIEYDKGGSDGMFDDMPYTPIKLVREIHRHLPPPPPPPPPRDPEIDDSETQELEEPRSPRQTMLQQYYGDREAEKRRNKSFDRFKSHIVQKEIDTYDEDGNKRKIEVYTVDEYEDREQDSNELLLDGYRTRLERLSRAHQRDFSPYKREFKRLSMQAKSEIISKYEEMHELNPEKAKEFESQAMEYMKSLDDPDFEKKVIQALIDKDTEFIETNNYSYNSRQTIAENLKTLGKMGENSVKAQISDEQSFTQKFGLKTMNTLISVRNHTTAPVNRAIGTFVASPIYRALLHVTQSKSKEPVNVDGYLITPMKDMLATSQKHTRGMFKNKPFHRYHARKDYFIEQEKEKIQNDNKDNPETEKGKAERTSIGKLIKFAIVPRVKSVINYKEGNRAILNAGLYDIEQATEERNIQMSQKRQEIINSMRRISECEKEINDLRDLEKIIKDPNEKVKISKAIKQKEVYKLKLEARLVETERAEIDSVSTDAVGNSVHDKSDKAKIGLIVKGVKTAGRVAAGTYISEYLYRTIANKVKLPDEWEYIEGTVKEIEKVVYDKIIETVPGLDKIGVGKITLGDIYSKGSGELSYFAGGTGNTIEDKTSIFKGLAFEYNGKLFSGSDGKGFDPHVLTEIKLDQPLNEDTQLVSVIQEIMEDTLGKKVPIEEIEKMLINGQISKIDIWRGIDPNSKGEGWLNASEIVPEIISGGTHEIVKEVPRTVIETIKTPGEWVLKPGIEYTEYVTKINPLIAAAEAGLGALELMEWNDVLRFTRSQEDIQMRSVSKLMKMANENEKTRAEKAEREAAEEKKAREAGKEPQKGKKKLDIKGTSRSDVPQSKRRRDIKSFQRTNKSKNRRYTHKGGKIKQASEIEAKRREGVTVFEGFMGTRKADFKSGYDENLIGVNKKETTIEIDERE